MHRSMLFALAASMAGCASDPQSEVELAAASQEVGSVEQMTRVHVAGDVYHYAFVLRVGDTVNARIKVHRMVRERAPWVPRRSTGAVMMLHGDFATFDTNFAVGAAPWLAERNLDVWGADRRWTLVPEASTDDSDFAAMGVEQELDDVGTALAFARGIRLVTDGSTDRLNLAGFSRGGELAYFYASREAARPAARRHVKGIVPLDVYASLSPADEDERQFFCQNARDQYDALEAGFVDANNDFQIQAGRGTLTAPDEPNVYIPDWTNRETLLWTVGQTYNFFRPNPLYHLLAPVLDGDTVTGLRATSETTAAQWLASSPFHGSMREGADTDALTCGDAPLPADVPLSRIRVPVFLLGAAGGYGDRAIYSTTQVSSTDVTTLIIRQLPVEREAEDFGHGDLLYAAEAPALAWQPLLAWLRRH